MIRFCAITEENFDAILAMKRPESERFVAPNSVSLAQAWLYRDNGGVFPFAVYNDGAPIGFMMLEEDAEEQELILWRLMFPPEHCGKGYGTEAVCKLISLARESGKYTHMIVDYTEGNEVARRVYEKAGFRCTGERRNGNEYAMRLEL